MSNPPWDSVIVQTKFHRPTLPTDLVSRPHLTKWLDQRCQRPLLLISAPAGYGKSTLISSWLKSVETPSAWLTLDENDNEMRSFLGYFITAIQSMYPKTLKETQTLLSAPELPPIRYLSGSLMNELNAIGEDYFLVLDDYHFIREISIHDLLDHLLRYPPRGMHLVIGTRSDPLLSLVNLRARGQVGEIRGQDLRFTLEEAKELLHNLLGEDIEEDTVLELEKKSEGWVTGLRLAALALRHRKGHLNIEGDISANNRFVGEYLTSEILEHQIATFSECLIKISILDRFCAGLCQAVCVVEPDKSQIHGGGFMEVLHASNLFVIPLDDQGQWARFHHIFRDFLRGQLERRYIYEEIATLHRRASAWFAQHGIIDVAINHALAADDLAGAVQLVEQNGRKLLNEDKWPVLEKWMACLPEEVIQQRPQLLIAKAWVAYYRFALNAIPPLLEAIDEIQIDDVSMKSLRGEVDFFWGNHWFWQGDNARSLNYLDRAIERIPIEYCAARGEAELFWSLALQVSGQYEKAIQKLNHWLYYEQKPHPAREPRLLGGLIFIYILSGDLTKADQVAKQFLEAAINNENAYAQAWGFYLLGNIQYCWNNLDKAADYFSRAVDNRYALHTKASIDSLAGLALTHQALGQSDKSEEIMELFLEYAYETNDPAYKTVARSCQARLALLRGDITFAEHWLQTTVPNTASNLMFYWLEIPEITQCRVMVREGSESNLHQATESLQKYWQLAKDQFNTRRMIDVSILQAVLNHKVGQSERAVSNIKYAITLAEPGDYIRPFVELGSELTPVFAGLIENDGETEFVSKILLACKNTRDTIQRLSVPTQIESIDPLTNREFEILELLKRRLTNKEIAAELHITVGTVQQHLNHIYAKLNVKGRRQAVTKATELDVLPFHR